MKHTDHLALILDRKQAEIERRLRRAARLDAWLERFSPQQKSNPDDVVAQLRRGKASLPRVIAEIKYQSPSAGVIRSFKPRERDTIVQGLVTAGASALSVLVDGPGFGGSVLRFRNVAHSVTLPVLFKEFVLHPIQIRTAQLVGASMVLLLVRALQPEQLHALIEVCTMLGLEPVVEAADEAELTIALSTKARLIGINARDLRSFSVDGGRATQLIEHIPEDRVAIYMSGVTDREAFLKVANTRADAVLVGESLMRAQMPGKELESWLKP